MASPAPEWERGKFVLLVNSTNKPDRALHRPSSGSFRYHNWQSNEIHDTSGTNPRKNPHPSWHTVTHNPDLSLVGLSQR
jgi:hypothetical protein